MEVLHAVAHTITEVALTALVVGSAIIVWAWIKEELL